MCVYAMRVYTVCSSQGWGGAGDTGAEDDEIELDDAMDEDGRRVNRSAGMWFYIYQSPVILYI